MEEVKTLTFDTSVSSMEYLADGEILVITYGKTIAFYNALRLIFIYNFSSSIVVFVIIGPRNPLDVNQFFVKKCILIIRN